MTNAQDKHLVGKGAEVEGGERHIPEISKILAQARTSESPEEVRHGAEKLKSYQNAKNKGRLPASVAHSDGEKARMNGVGGTNRRMDTTIII